MLCPDTLVIFHLLMRSLRIVSYHWITTSSRESCFLLISPSSLWVCYSSYYFPKSGSTILGSTTSSLATSWPLCPALLTRLCVALERWATLSASWDLGGCAWLDSKQVHAASTEGPSKPLTGELHGPHQIPSLCCFLFLVFVMMTYILCSKSSTQYFY